MQTAVPFHLVIEREGQQGGSCGPSDTVVQYYPARCDEIAFYNNVSEFNETARIDPKCELFSDVTDVIATTSELYKISRRVSRV